MSTNPTVTPVPPLPLRILATWDEFNTALYAARRETHRFRPTPDVDHGAAEEMVRAALAAVGVVTTAAPAVESLDAECCTAQCLMWEAGAVEAEALRECQQCGDAPGHDGTDHGNREFGWSDGQSGTVPARPTAEA
ncbi:hypothetical protein AB0D34_07860 [Streptomyces sp. NPDC048420]|uniref:hypothetical protein n=1 Tax=Streptomyces sp. NPDC048420 TaxID=3155755 RepID=UPI0034213DAC